MLFRSVFLESILFLQKLKIFKNNVALFWQLGHGSSKLHATAASSQVVFGDLFASGRSSHKEYIEIFMTQLVILSGVRLPVAKKHLANFFKSFGLKCFGRCPGD